MAHTFEIHGEVATEVTANRWGKLELIVENGSGLTPIYVPRGGSVGAEVAALSPGDRIAVEIEKDGKSWDVLAVHITYARGLPRIG